MESGNLSAVTEFIFTGVPKLQDGGLLYFFPLLFIYTFIVIKNLMNPMIFFAVRLDAHLHNPMYNFVTTILKTLSNLISNKNTISFIGCLLQMYFFHTLGNTEGGLLTVMAIDRYLSAGSCIFGFLILLPEIMWISILPFCGSYQIHQIFCDFTPLLNLACTDAFVILVQDVIHALAILITGLIISLSYIRIVIVIQGISSAEGHKKAFFTCAVHIAVFLLFFGSVALMYLRFTATYIPFWDTTIALTFSVLAPFFNPIIYSQRNKDMKDAIKKLLCSPKMESPNQTTAQFIFSAFPYSWGDPVICFVPLLFIYVFIVVGNLVIITVVQLNTHLHTPMYFINALSFLEIW
ncbi:hypothetical protein E2I00_010512 [Balaenoptera physalus]|uniref:G-protein coupled receptors family 1 profile domain-containing protein n=1 Tax=Balaenoptera physalus TaxID=9770 RepID=A0A643BUA9_BALPH|nr:hypothetical protein E2I00_010512 [Balaenoptera physalus]